jgi:hypothetical protein
LAGWLAGWVGGWVPFRARWGVVCGCMGGLGLVFNGRAGWQAGERGGCALGQWASGRWLPRWV